MGPTERGRMQYRAPPIQSACPNVRRIFAERLDQTMRTGDQHRREPKQALNSINNAVTNKRFTDLFNSPCTRKRDPCPSKETA
jgi:hypothetical protein